MASDEQIRQHCPKLFDDGFYLERVQKELAELTRFSVNNPLKSGLPKEDQERFDAYTASLAQRVHSELSAIPFEFDIQRESEESDGEKVTQAHNISVALKNIDDLLNSVKQPVQDLEKLYELSSLVSRLKSQADRLKGSLPDFRDHVKKHTIEIKALRGELKDLEEQEKEGELTRAEKIQKEQLEKDMETHRQIIQKNSQKIAKRKKRISGYEQKISSIIQSVAEFIRQFDPENPKPFSDSLNPEKFQKNGEMESKSLSVHSKMREILQVERNGKYTAYNPQLEQKLRWMDRKRAVIKWTRRLALSLIAVGSIALVGREQIADAILGPRLNAEAFSRAGVEMPTDPQVILELATHNKELAADKVKILQHLNNDLNNEEKRRLTRAELPIDIADILVRLVQRTNWQDTGSDKVTFRLKESVVRGLMEIFGQHFYLKLKPVKKGEKERWINGDSEDVWGFDGRTGAVLAITNNQLCDVVSVDIQLRVLLAGKYPARVGQEIIFNPSQSRKLCLESFDNPEDRALEEAKYIRAGEKNYLNPDALGKPKTDDLGILAQLHIRNAALPQIKIDIIEMLARELDEDLTDDLLTILEKKENFRSIDNSKTLGELKDVLLRIIPNVSYDVIEEKGEKKAVVIIHPYLVRAFQILFGDDTETTLSFLSDQRKGDVSDTGELMKIDYHLFCRPHTHLFLAVRKRDSKGGLAELYDRREAKEAYELCPEKKASPKNTRDFLAHKQKIIKHPIVEYWMDKQPGAYDVWHSLFDEVKTESEMRTFLTEWLKGLAEREDFREDYEKIFRQYKKIKLLSFEDFEDKLEEDENLKPEWIKDQVFFQVHPDFEKAIRKKFGDDAVVDLGHTAGAGMSLKGNEKLNYMHRDFFCGFENFKFKIHLSLAKDLGHFRPVHVRELKTEELDSEFFEACLPDGFRKFEGELEGVKKTLLRHPFVLNHFYDTLKKELREVKTDAEFYRYSYDLASMFKRDYFNGVMNRSFDYLLGEISPFDPASCNNPMFRVEFAEAAEKRFGTAKVFVGPSDPQETDNCKSGSVVTPLKLVVQPPFPYADPIEITRDVKVNFMDKDALGALEADKRAILSHPIVSKYLNDYDQKEFRKRKTRGEFETYLDHLLEQLKYDSEFQKDLGKFAQSVKPHLTVDKRSRIKVSPEMITALKQKYGDDIQIEFSVAVGFDYKKFPVRKKARVNFKDFCDQDGTNSVRIHVRMPVSAGFSADFNLKAKIPSEFTEKSCPKK